MAYIWSIQYDPYKSHISSHIYIYMVIYIYGYTTDPIREMHIQVFQMPKNAAGISSLVRCVYILRRKRSRIEFWILYFHPIGMNIPIYSYNIYSSKYKTNYYLIYTITYYYNIYIYIYIYNVYTILHSTSKNTCVYIYIYLYSCINIYIYIFYVYVTAALDPSNVKAVPVPIVSIGHVGESMILPVFFGGVSCNSPFSPYIYTVYIYNIYIIYI